MPHHKQNKIPCKYNPFLDEKVVNTIGSPLSNRKTILSAGRQEGQRGYMPINNYKLPV